MRNKKNPSGPTPSDVPLPRMRRGPKSYYNDVIREMRHVNWPTTQETNRLTGVVLAVCGIVVVILTVLSIVFQTFFDILFGKV